MRKNWKRRLGRMALLLGIAWTAMSLLAAFFYPRLLYHPETGPPDITPATLGKEFGTIRLTAADGVRLQGWFVPGRPCENAIHRQTLLVFHGNAGNLGTATFRLAGYSDQGFDSFMVDYRGFGESDGAPTEAGLLLDAEAAWRYLTVERGVPPENIIIFGYSLGGAVAAALAASHPEAAGLILESTFTCLADVARDFFPFLPCRLIVGKAWNTRDRLRRVRLPLLVIHGRQDQLVAYKYGCELYKNYGGRKTFLRIADDHNIGFLLSGDSYFGGIAAFAASLRADGTR
ncbi:MAG: alpha/beta hydrolase [Planctomycetes bacterium]|nr:alpha/beta hydrolase [Planctomycetota bacterium]